MKHLTTVALGVLVFAARPALADDIDVQAFEYVDVVETSDGTILKGIVVEQEPGSKYKVATADGSIHVIKADEVVKLTKQRNKLYRGRQHAMRDDGDASGGDLSASYDRSSSLPRPKTKTGPRADVELAIVVPRGDIDMLDTSYAPTFRVGYEYLAGNFGIAGGGLARFTYWMLPGDTQDAAWTLEAHAFMRAGLHIGRVAPYAGLSLGPDINYLWINAFNKSDTQVGIGVNLGTGVSIAATETVALDFGADYHPATDVLGPDKKASVEYIALRFGSSFRW